MGAVELRTAGSFFKGGGFELQWRAVRASLRRAVVASRKANRRPRNKQDATIKWRQEAAAPGTGSSTLGPFPRNDLPPLVASTTTRPIIRLDAKGCLVESHEEILSLFEEQPAILPPLKLYLLKKYGRRHDDLPLMPCADPKLRRERTRTLDGATGSLPILSTKSWMDELSFIQLETR